MEQKKEGPTIDDSDKNKQQNESFESVDSDIQEAKKKMLSEGLGSQSYKKQPTQTGDFITHGLDKNIGFIRFVIYDGSGILFLENEYGTATLSMRMKNKLIAQDKLAKFSKEILLESCEEVYDLLPDKTNEQFKNTKKDFFDYCVWIFHLSTIVNAPTQVRKDELLNALDLIVPDVLFVQDRPCFSYFPTNSNEFYIESGLTDSSKIKSHLGLTDEQLKQREKDYQQFSYALTNVNEDEEKATEDVDNANNSITNFRFYSNVGEEEGLSEEAGKVISTGIDTPTRQLDNIKVDMEDADANEKNDSRIESNLNEVSGDNGEDDVFDLSRVDEE